MKIRTLVIEVTWKRRKGNPVQFVMLTTSGPLWALFACADIAKQLKVPQSWVQWVPFDGRSKHRHLLKQRAKIVARTLKSKRKSNGLQAQ